MSAKKPSVTAHYLLRLSQMSERQSKIRNRAIAAVAFGLCAFLVAIAPARDQKQGALAQAQARADASAIARFKRLKDPKNGYARVSELRLSQAGYEASSSWGALTRAEPLPYGMGFLIEHAFASRDACAAYAPLAAELADQLLIDGALAHDRREPSERAPESFCSQGQNALRLIVLDPGELQIRVAQRPAPVEAAIPAAEMADPRIPGGYLAPRAEKATPEQLAEAERGAGRTVP